MLNVVYLVLVVAGGTGELIISNIPQANMQQCLINAKEQLKDTGRRYDVVRAKCIVGVMSK